jgi:hypothetical protein
MRARRGQGGFVTSLARDSAALKSCAACRTQLLAVVRHGATRRNAKDMMLPDFRAAHRMSPARLELATFGLPEGWGRFMRPTLCQLSHGDGFSDRRCERSSTWFLCSE